MIQSFIYGGHSGVVDRGDGRAIRLAPILRASRSRSMPNCSTRCDFARRSAHCTMW